MNVKNCGSTALHLAIQNGHFDVAIWLIDNGADINVQVDNLNWTPLHIAIKNYLKPGFASEMYSLIKKLIERGADTSIADSEGLTFIQIAEKENINSVFSLFPSGENESYDLYESPDATVNMLLMQERLSLPDNFYISNIWNLEIEKEIKQKAFGMMNGRSFDYPILEVSSGNSLPILIIPAESINLTLEQLYDFMGNMYYYLSGYGENPQ